jgi:hypothetical protein
VIKSNLSTFPDPIGLKVDQEGVHFGEVLQPPQVETARDQATDLLLSLLERCPMKSTQVREAFEQAGISWRTANKAKKQLGIVAVRQEDTWFWSLPFTGQEEAE